MIQEIIDIIKLAGWKIKSESDIHANFEKNNIYISIYWVNNEKTIVKIFDMNEINVISYRHEDNMDIILKYITELCKQDNIIGCLSVYRKYRIQKALMNF